jgi:DNA polymerase-3 subunit gamma/tau
VLGQEHVVRALSHALESGRLHHAYLFTGTRGVGKTTLARILAKCLNCARGVGATPCGDCDPCRDIDAGRFSDVLEVDAATNTKVEDMRELLENAHYRPVSGRFKVYIVDEVHMLSKHAFNAMLKTLEEPPAHMKFILATTDPQKVPVTVLSRCLQFSLKPMTVDQLVPRLEHILAVEQVPFEAAALRLVARAAHGSVRDCLSVLDQAIAFGGGRIATAQVADLLGVAAADALLELAEALAARDGQRLLTALGGLIDAGQSPDALLQDFSRLMQQLALVQLLPAVATPAETDEAAALSGLATRFDAPEVQLCYQIALAGRRDLVHAPDEPAGLTMTFLRMLTFLDMAGGSAGPMARGDSGASRPARPEASPGAAGATHAPAPPLRAGVAAPAPVLPARPAAAVAAPPDTPEGGAAMPLPDSPAEWLAVVDALPPAGVALELARHCLWRGRQGSRLQLALAQGHKALLTTSDRLQSLLGRLLGPVQLQILLETLAVESAPQGSAASRDDARRAQRLLEAEQALAADPVVQALLRDQGGRIVDGSIRLRDEAA